MPKLTYQAHIRLNGSNAKEHPVFRELTRARQYFDKIKDAEGKGQEKHNISLNKAVANRIVKHALVRVLACTKVLWVDDSIRLAMDKAWLELDNQRQGMLFIRQRF